MAVRVHDLIPQRVLVTRESARILGPILASVLEEGSGRVELDFSNIEGVTPSFLDETLRIIEEAMLNASGGDFAVLIKNSPTRLSSKFLAVGRTHGLSIRESDERTWLIVPQESEG